MFDRHRSKPEVKNINKRELNELEDLIRATGMASKFVAFRSSSLEKPSSKTVADMHAESVESQDPVKPNTALTGLVALDAAQADASFARVLKKYGDAIINSCDVSEKRSLLTELGADIDASYPLLFTYNRMILAFNQMIVKVPGISSFKGSLTQHRDTLIKSYREFRDAPTEASLKQFMDDIANTYGKLKEDKEAQSRLIALTALLTAVAVAATILLAVFLPPMLALVAPLLAASAIILVCKSATYRRMGDFLNTFGTFSFSDVKLTPAITSEDYTPPKSAA